MDKSNKKNNRITNELNVAIILLNYNGWEDTLECLDSIEKVHGVPFTTVVVDNASPSRPKDLMREVERRAGHFIQASRNGGFAYGNNLGIRWALDKGFPYVLLLNNDTVVNPDFLAKMLDKMERDSSIGVLGSLILYYDEPDRVWFNGARINWWKGSGKHYDVGRKVAEVSYHEGNDYITGCVLLVRAEVFRDVGLLDETYFMYFEDVTFSQKVIRAGYRIDYEPDAVIYHKVSASGGGGNENWVTVYHGNLSRLRFIKSNMYEGRGIQRVHALLFFYVTRGIKAAIYLLKWRPQLLSALYKSFTVKT